MNYKKSRQERTTENEIPSREIKSLGDLFKEEREKKGLSLKHVANTIRLRPHIIKALEDEDWDNLPLTAFTRGFIRSYAQILEIDEKRAIDLYENIFPVEASSLKPFIESGRFFKRSLLLPVILLLGITFIIIYLVKDNNSQEKPFTQVQQENISKAKAGLNKKIQPEALEKEGLKSVENQKVNSKTSNTETDSKEEGRSSEGHAVMETPIEAERDDSSVAPSIDRDMNSTDWLVLKSVVKQRTWVKIYIDDQYPKEYIFQPGSRPQWKAEKGFNIIVGNASGMEFDFNGKKINNLGNLGSVVRLRLPEDFKVPGFGD